jgi:Domain of unknown function (DUF2017)
MFGRLVRRTRSGDFEIRLSEEERRLLGGLVPQLRALLAEGEPADDPALRRLFPTAHPDDPARDAEYRGLVHGELLERRRAALDVVEATVGATRLSEAQLLAWMGAVNDLRLVLGTQLDVSEETDLARLDADDPASGALAIYGYLGHLLEAMVDALA